MKKEFLEYIGPADSLQTYVRSYKLVLLKCFFELMDPSGCAFAYDVSKRVKAFYEQRVDDGKIPDMQVESRIQNIKQSSVQDVYNVIMLNPFKYINENGYLLKRTAPNGKEQFYLPPQLTQELTADDLKYIQEIIESKLALYYSKIDIGKIGVSIREFVKKFTTEYVPSKRETFAGHPFGNYIRNVVPKLIYDTNLVNKDEYLITGSVGQGIWSTVPWVCIFDKRITTSATKGVYIVYLLSKDGNRLYLTLNQGCTEISQSHNKQETIAIMRKKAEEVVSKVDNRGFSSDQNASLGEGLTQLAEFYEKGIILYKEYSKDAIPEEDELREDLQKMMEVYKEYASREQPKSNGKLVKEKFREWFAEKPQKNNPSIKYSPNTIDAAVRLLESGMSKLGLAKYANLNCFDITDYSEFKIVRDECYSFAEKFDKNQFHGDFRNGLDFYLLYLKELTQFKELLEIFVRQLKINNDIISGEKIYGQGYKDMPKIQSIYQHCREFDGYILELNLQAGYNAYNSSNYINLRETWINIVPVFQETSAGSHDVSALQVMVKPDNKVTNDYPAETVEDLGLFDEKAPNKTLVSFFADFKREIDKHHNETNNYDPISRKEGEKEMTTKEKINAIKTYIAAKGFNYEGNLVENFYLSLKSKPFVILAGTSGTGKTRLVKLFAGAIGAKMKLVPVRPDWSDSSDLFGHTDLSGHFQPGAIIDFIKQAESDKNTPHFLCLDEMNLARVEYYLSDFLSIIETRDRKVTGEIETDPLVDIDYYKDEDAKGNYGRVFIPENLYIVGTVNMDETTFPFSKKVLDRANTIEFSYVNLTSKVSVTGEAVEQKLDNTFLKTDYLYLNDCDDSDLVDGICFDLEELNQILVKANLHVGYRVRDEISFYMMNNKKAKLLSEDVAFDNEIMQKILPRVQGSSSAIKEVLSELFIKCAGDYTGFSGISAYEQMTSYIDSKNCKYPNSAKKITFMMRRYEEDGFTSYWL